MTKPKTFRLADALGSLSLYRQLEDVYNSNGNSRVDRVEDLVAMGQTVSQAQESVVRSTRRQAEQEAIYDLFHVVLTPETKNGDFPEIEVSATQRTFGTLTRQFAAVAQAGSRLALPFAKITNHMMIHAPHTVTQSAVNHLVPGILVSTEQIAWDDQKGPFPLPNARLSLVAELNALRDTIAPRTTEFQRGHVNRTVVERAISPGEYTEMGLGTNPGVHPSSRASFLNACYSTNPNAFTPAHLKALHAELIHAKKQRDSFDAKIALLGFAASP